MKSYWFVTLGLLLVACSSPPGFSVDEQTWTGEATGGSQRIVVKVSFTQEAETVEARLELGQTPETLEATAQPLVGTLQDTALSVAAPAGDSIRGVFEDNTFTGVLSLLVDTETDDFVLRLNQEQ
jgi:hypothetical protein